VWAASEYLKLPRYDGDIMEQIGKDGIALFYCHQQDGNLCAGWVGCHNKTDNAALRINAHRVTPETFDYESPVPLFSSGTEAALHGLSGVEDPSPEAKRLVDKLSDKLGDKVSLA